MKTSNPSTPSNLISTLPNWCKAIALCVPLISHACPKLKDWNDAWPSKPIKDPAQWRSQMVKKEGCPDRTGSEAAAQYDLQFSGVQLVYDPCNSGRNRIYVVFYPVAGHSNSPQYCAIGTTGGTIITEVPSAPSGYVRIETYWHNNAYEGDIATYELRPSGIVQIGKTRHVGQRPD